MTITPAKLVSGSRFYEDFESEAVYRHARAKTVTEMDNVLLTNLVVNTAQAHFNEHDMLDTPFGQRITFGGITTALVVGLVSQDITENAEAESGFDSIKLLSPVFHGDTLYAYSEVLEKDDHHDPATGRITFRHYGMNQRGQLVFDGTRSIVMRRRHTPQHGS
jgi:itaconyl-CoA hydratase